MCHTQGYTLFFILGSNIYFFYESYIFEIPKVLEST